MATPALLRAYGINPSSIPSNVDILSSRPGLAGSGVQLTYGGGGKGGGGWSARAGAAGVRSGQHERVHARPCLAHPVVQEESQLPTGTSAPNTVITESALRRLHLASQNSLDGWMLQANSPITSAQITTPNSLAAANNLSIESKNDAPTSAEIVNWATVFGIALALGILAMSVGLIRSETASDLRTLTATGASSRTRRSLTAVTAGGLAFLGALLGTVAAYVGAGRMVPLELAGGWPVGHHRSHPVEQPVPHRDRHAARRHPHRLGAGGTGADGDRHPPDGVVSGLERQVHAEAIGVEGTGPGGARPGRGRTAPGRTRRCRSWPRGCSAMKAAMDARARSSRGWPARS